MTLSMQSNSLSRKTPMGMLGTREECSSQKGNARNTQRSGPRAGGALALPRFYSGSSLQVFKDRTPMHKGEHKAFRRGEEGKTLQLCLSFILAAPPSNHDY